MEMEKKYKKSKKATGQARRPVRQNDENGSDIEENNVEKQMARGTRSRPGRKSYAEKTEEEFMMDDDEAAAAEVAEKKEKARKPGPKPGPKSRKQKVDEDDLGILEDTKEKKKSLNKPGPKSKTQKNKVTAHCSKKTEYLSSDED